MMIIRNKSNENLAINTRLVASYFKGKEQNHVKPFTKGKEQNHVKPFTICFVFAGGMDCEPVHEVWRFESEDDRNNTWLNIMGCMSAEYL